MFFRLSLYVLVSVFSWIVTLAPAKAFETTANNVFVIDAGTKAVLFDKAGEERIPTASMSKMMTAYVVFEQLKAGKLKLDDTLPVSEEAWRTGQKDNQSKMWVELGSHVSVEDLLRGMIVQSGNDACVVLAEGVAGSVEDFAKMMNESAQKIGLHDSHFTNPHGLPDPDHYSTARDLAYLGMHLINDFPEYYHYFSEIDFTYHGIRQGNRNPLLYGSSGADGIKTGHTEELGYSLAASVKRGDRRIVMVATGLQSKKGRSEEAERIIEWAFREFQNYQIVKKGAEVDQADVWIGQAPTVPLVAADDLVVTLPREARKDMKVTASYDAPLKAPVTAGVSVGTLTVSAPDMQPQSVGLQTGGSVARLGPVARIGSALDYLIWHGKS
jgi:D-alanyl-D-alanine carboxypeptidase (penicillin-binding protein 5/6)